VIDYLLSGWSFFFRWPVANAKSYRAVGVFLGPLLQMIVYIFFAVAASFVILPPNSTLYAPIISWVGLSMLTGFFHEDGLADTADSLGVSKFNSEESLDKIHSTFKDPRLGTFGVSALVLFWAFRILSVTQGHLSITLCALVCLCSRTSALFWGLYFFPRVVKARSARSSHIMQSVNARTAGLILLLGLLTGILLCSFAQPIFAGGAADVVNKIFPDVPSSSAVFALCFTVMLLLSGAVLRLLILRTEALNGDLLGATACLSEVFLTICIIRIL